MKKIFIIILAMVLLLSLVACGGDKPKNEDPLNRDPGTTQGNNQTPGGNTTDNINIDNIISGNSGSDVILSEADSAYKAELVRQAEESGMTVLFGNDGSTTLTDEDGNKYVQKKDGTWTYEGVNGESAVIGGNVQWPENEYTAAVPKPSMKLSFIDTDNYSFSAQFSSGTMDDAKAYVAQLKTAGFITTEDERTITGVYAYNATDITDTYGIIVSYINGQGVVLLIEKLDTSDDPGDDQGNEGDGEQGGSPVDSLEEWPENDITAGVPKPDLAIQMVMSEENAVLVYCGVTSLSKAKDYVQELKSAGYNVNIVESDEYEGMYIYQADNSTGNKVSVTWVDGDGLTINIYKFN